MRERKIFKFLQILCILNLASAADIDIGCDFTNAATPFEGTTSNTLPASFYTCTVTNTSILPGSNVVAFLGTHLDPNTEVDVKVLKVDGTSFIALPTNIENIFTALEGISITSTDFEILTPSDLAPFATKLKYFSAKDSKLTFLEEKLFEAFLTLEYIDFSGNPIIYVDPTIFNGLTALKILRPSVSLCTDFDPIIEGTDIGVFAGNLATLDSACVKAKALQTALRTRIQSHLDDKALLASNEADLAQCQDDLDTCQSTTTPDCPITPQPDETTLEPSTDDPTTIAPDEDCQVMLQLQIIETNLYKNYTEVCEAEKAKLKDEVEDLEAELEKYMPSNITCRFKDTDDGYTCSGHGLIIKSAATQKVSWIGSHLDGKSNADVETLLIKAQETQFLPLDVGKTFTSLKNLIVDTSKLQKIGAKDFATLTGLTKISITGNEIKAIEGRAFDSLTNLEHLSLRNNQITSLPSKIFFKLNQLTFLDIGENKINQFRYDLIPAANKLEEFYADHNPNRYVDIIFIWQMSRANIIDLRETQCNLFFNRTMNPSFKGFFNEIVAGCA